MSTSSHVVALRLPTEIYNVIAEIAKKEDIPVTFVVRRFLKKGLGMQQHTTPLHTANTPSDAKADEIVESWE